MAENQTAVPWQHLTGTVQGTHTICQLLTAIYVE